jgi:hypothetical protein
MAADHNQVTSRILQELRVIRDISRYCDRWCRSCRFTHRCGLYIEMKEARRIKGDCSMVINLLGGERGVPSDTVEIYSGEMIPPGGLKSYLLPDPVVSFKKYTTGLRKWFMRQRQQVLSCIFSDNAAYFVAYHCRVIGIRYGEAISELQIPRGSRQDVDGLAKAILVSGENSLKTLDILSKLLPGSREEILELRGYLERFMQDMQCCFPGAWIYRRPGLDESEMGRARG